MNIEYTLKNQKEELVIEVLKDTVKLRILANMSKKF